MPPDLFSIVKPPVSTGHPIILFCLLRDEMYFLPHLLEHYRALGIEEFWFLDDRSVDGSREYLLEQRDCGVLESPYTFADHIEGKRYPVAMKNHIPGTLFDRRWVITVDADEFLLLPSACPDFHSLTQTLQQKPRLSVRALMFDFFPAHLADIPANSSQSPFELSPYFAPLDELEWPESHSGPTRLDARNSIRPRMLQELRSRGIDPVGSEYKLASLHKAPVLFRTQGVEVLHSHGSNVPLGEDIQIAIAHFKFYPGYQDKIKHALSAQSYYNGSIEYRLLDAAASHLRDWDMRNPNSRLYESPQSLEDCGMIWAR